MHSNVKLRNPIPQYERLPWKQRNVAQSPDPGSPTCARSGVSAGEAGLVFSQGWLMTWEKMVEGDESSDFHRDLLGFHNQKISNSWCVFFIPAFDGGNHENSDTKTTKTPLETMESTTRVFHCFKGWIALTSRWNWENHRKTKNCMMS